LIWYPSCNTEGPEKAYVPSSNPKAKNLQGSDEHTNQPHRNDPLKVMDAAEKEWDQLNTRLVRYDQNSEQTLLLKLPGGHVRPWIGYVRFRRICPVSADISGNRAGYVRPTQKFASQF
jgi:hypothetical protein